MSSEYKSFSERYGYTQPKLPQREMMDDDLRVGLWNAFYEIVEIKSWLRLHYSKGDLYREIFTNFLKKPYNEYDYHLSIESIKSVFLNGKWHEVYNLIEFIIVRYSYIIAQCNNILERENSAYRIVNKLVTEITSEQEITEIETALQIPFESVKSRLEKALALFSDREKPDYENSIKASISAVESIAKEIIGKEKSLNALTQELKLHPNLANALNELYNWTSKDGIRHGASRKHLSVNQDNARLQWFCVMVRARRKGRRGDNPVISTIKIQHVIVAVLALAFAATAPDTHAQAAVPAVEETVVGSGVKETVATPTLDAAVKMEIRRQNDELRNELRRQYLDDRAESLTWWAKKINLWLAVVAILLTALGIAIPIALASRMKRFRYIETEAREAVKKAQESVDKAREAADKAEKAKDKAFKDSEDIEEKKRKIEEMSTLPERVSDYADALPHIGQSEKFTEEDLEKHIFSVSDKIHRDPKHAAAYNIRGLFKAKLGRHQDAIEDYNESIRLDPKPIHAHYFRGISKAALGRYHVAIEDYDETIRLNEKHINAHMYRGFAKAGLDRIMGEKGALSDLQIALNLAKESGDDEAVTKISNAIWEIEQWRTE